MKCSIEDVQPKPHSRGASLDLLQEYRRSPTSNIRNQLVQLNLGLVRREVNHWLHQCTETYDDLLQVGCLGLIRAIERYDLSRGHAFSSFAVPYIRGEIQHYLRDKSPTIRVPRQWLELQREGNQVIQKLQTKLGRRPTDLEIAAYLGISLEDWNQAKLAGCNRSLLSLDAPVQDEGEGTTCLGEIVPDTRYRSFQLAQEDQIRLQQALAKLEEGTRRVLEFVFLQDLTQKETAERMGISPVTVSRRVKRGLGTLKQVMVSSEIEEES
ncbi:MAG: RNA polymerase sigma factor SigF [Oscillatoriales cyanobacterium RM1_1_9]|nr:RNA polymerase sigma factor SigF [Oscillatoriales cyanobacterium SM2_3_0]NJO46683.1 RNA polymerase sigma factor SigF [Oscillatoriales cyanobacterium RM2_1_1]NJO72250.1 RNA polymerase sigma factor SigF [Oscillatoriales cyanobacterium RM1_1_9]